MPGDAAATERTRDALRAERGAPQFFDRGPGYEQLARADQVASSSTHLATDGGS